MDHKEQIGAATGDTVTSFKQIDFRWSEVEEMHRVVATELANNGLRIAALVKQDKLKPYRETTEYKKFVVAGHLIITTLTTNLNAIHAKYKGKKGELRNSEDYWLATEVTSHYKAYRSDMQIAIASVSRSLIEMYTNGEKAKLKEEVKDEQ